MLADLLGLAAHCRGSLTVRLALAWLLGSGPTAFWMLLVSLAGIRWNLPVILLPWAGVVAAWGFRRLRPGAGVSASAETPTVPASGTGGSLPPWVGPAGQALIGIAVVLACVEALIPLSAWGNWDAWAIWNLKVRAFWTAGGLPKPFLLELRYDFSHPDYPPGMPLLQTFLAYWAGGVSETLLRCAAPLYHLALVWLMAGLLRELGLKEERWLLAGAYAIMPRVFEQAHTGYSDLPLAAAATAALLFLVRATRGEAPPWTVALFCGIAGLIKGEGLILSAGCGALIGVWWLAGRTGSKQALAAWALMFALLAPWRGVVAGWGLKPTFEISGSRLLTQAPMYIPYIVKADALEAFGPELTVPRMRETGPLDPLDIASRQRRTWAGFWYFVAAAIVVGSWPALVRPVGASLAALLLLQFASTWAVTLGAQYEVIWVLVTSVDRMLLQVSPVAFAVAGACVAVAGIRAPPAVPPKGTKPKKSNA
jgi:hypothetical protein